MVTKNLGNLLLAILLIVSGIVGLGVAIPKAALLLACLSIAAGVLILLGK